MPTSSSKAAVAGAPKPRLGKNTLVIKLDGITGAPILRGYRPQGLKLLKEFSLVSGNGSRSALLSVNGDGCYRITSPLWKKSASGKDGRAEIHIDVLR